MFEASGDLKNEPEKKAIIYSRIGNLHSLLNNWKESEVFHQRANDLRLKATADPYDLEYYRNFLEEAKSTSQSN